MRCSPTFEDGGELRDAESTATSRIPIRAATVAAAARFAVWRMT
jgi:hypothetical protein